MQFSIPSIQDYAWNSWEIFEPSLKLNLCISLNSPSFSFPWVRSSVFTREMELHISRGVPSTTGYNHRQVWVGSKNVLFCFDLLFRYPYKIKKLDGFI